MFSATGKILPGSNERPEYATLVFCTEKGRISNTQTRTWNKCGWIPVVSTFTGCARTLLGSIHAIVHFNAAIFDSKHRSQHLDEAVLGGKNIG